MFTGRRGVALIKGFRTFRNLLERQELFLLKPSLISPEAPPPPFVLDKCDEIARFRKSPQ